MMIQQKQSKSGYYFFVAVISAFMLWIMLIHPLTEPAQDMPFIFAYNQKTHQVYPRQQKIEYAEYTGGAILFAMIMTIPIIVNDHKHDKAMELLWNNRNNIKHEDYMSLMDKLTYHVWRPGNSKEIIAETNKLIKKYEGRDLVQEKYGFSKALVS